MIELLYLSVEQLFRHMSWQVDQYVLRRVFLLSIEPLECVEGVRFVIDPVDVLSDYLTVVCQSIEQLLQPFKT